MKNKIRVGIIFGGRSAEHEVSIQSAKSVYEAIDKEKYDVALIGIDKKGEWHVLPAHYHKALLSANNPKTDLTVILNEMKDLTLPETSIEILRFAQNDKSILDTVKNMDVVFPVMHGTNSEDGTIQGYLKLLNIPFVGPSVLGAAVTMDKDVTKRLLRDAGLPIPKFVVYGKEILRQAQDDKEGKVFQKIVQQLGLPFFAKPPTLGSSIGVSKVKNENDFKRVIEDVFQFDTKIMFEEAIIGRELECAVLGNEHPQASIVGEVIPNHEFYDYDAKYIDADGATLKIPAELSEKTIATVRHLAVRTFQILCCEGMSRVDFFLDKNEKVYVNEVNPIPGFTKISMYPKLWEASGIAYTDLIDRLIELAVERHTRDQQLKTVI